MKQLILNGFILSLFLFSCSQKHASSVDEVSNTKKENLSIEEEMLYSIANAYGYNNWNEVKEVKFSFNVDRGETKSVRNWVWNPQTDNVLFVTDEKTINFNRADELSDELKKVDANFINDQFWAFVPLNLIQAESLETSISTSQKAPINGEVLTKVTIVYPNSGGYTPGDAYDLFVDENYNVKEWIFRKGNVKEPSMATTWEGNKLVNGILIAENHYTPDQAVNISITNVEVIK